LCDDYVVYICVVAPSGSVYVVRGGEFTKPYLPLGWKEWDFRAVSGLPQDVEARCRKTLLPPCGPDGG
jgi:hypothetical protein